MYYSQFSEDKILDSIFTNKNNGFCVEVGANDGINDSTTYYFEKKGWSCVLIEPNPDLCKIIRENRISPVVQCAASNVDGHITLNIAEGADRAHGVSTINSDTKSLEKIKSYGFTYREVSVLTKTLDVILDEIGKDQSIDFISIDVEGHELEVLSGFSVARWKPRIIILEDNSCGNDLRVRNYLRKFEYIPFSRTGVNDWYAKANDYQLVNPVSKLKYLAAMSKIQLRNKYPILSRIKKAFKIF